MNTTPTPWAATDCASHIQIHREGYPRDAWSVCSVGHQAQDAGNAELIVRAVNSHEALLAALLEYIERQEAAGDPTGLPEYEQACAAIAKARGEA